MSLFEVPVERVGHPPKDPIGEMAGALTDPIIVFPGGGWEQDIPQKLKDGLPIYRLAHIMKCLKGEASWEEATDLEALIYMFPATLAFPLDHNWTEIYLYLGTKHMGDKFPDDIGKESLSDYQMSELRELKRWIHKKRVEARKARRRSEKAQEVEIRESQYEQLRMPL